MIHIEQVYFPLGPPTCEGSGLMTCSWSLVPTGIPGEVIWDLPPKCSCDQLPLGALREARLGSLTSCPSSGGDELLKRIFGPILHVHAEPVSPTVLTVSWTHRGSVAWGQPPGPHFIFHCQYPQTATSLKFISFHFKFWLKKKKKSMRRKRFSPNHSSVNPSSLVKHTHMFLFPHWNGHWTGLVPE